PRAPLGRRSGLALRDRVPPGGDRGRTPLPGARRAGVGHRGGAPLPPPRAQPPRVRAPPPAGDPNRPRPGRVRRRSCGPRFRTPCRPRRTAAPRAASRSRPPSDPGGPMATALDQAAATRTVFVPELTNGILDPDEPMLGPVQDGGT